MSAQVAACRRSRRRGPARAAVLGHARQLHRPLQHRRARSRAADGRRRADVVRPGRIRGHRRLHDGDPGDALRRIPLAESRCRTRAHVRARAVPGLHHVANARPLFPARDHRVGHESLFPVRQRRVPGRPYRAHRRACSRRARFRAQGRALLLLPDLGHCARRALGHRQSARLAARASDSRAPRPARDVRGLRRRRGPAQDRRLRLRGASRVRVGLALCASATVRESDAVRTAAGDRISLHGRRRWRRKRLGRGRGRDADHAREAAAPGLAARDPGPQRQFRDGGLRRVDGDRAPAGARGCVAVDRALAAASAAVARAGGTAPARARPQRGNGRSARRAQGAQAVRWTGCRERSLVLDSSGGDPRA